MVAIIAWLAPDLLGSGQGFVNGIIEGNVLTLQTIALFFIIRFLVTIGSSSSGASGGIFMPVLVPGALLGFGDRRHYPIAVTRVKGRREIICGCRNGFLFYRCGTGTLDRYRTNH
jgi:Voltage gated chloride channel